MGMMKKALSVSLLFLILATPVFGKTRHKTKTPKGKPAHETSVLFTAYQGSSNFSLFPIRSNGRRLEPHLIIFDSPEAWETVVKSYPGTLIVEGVSSSDPSKKVDISAVYGPIDFSKRIYAEWVWGEKSSTGYEIRLDKITAGPTFRCYLKTKAPEKKQKVEKVKTTPSFSALVALAHADKDFEVFLDGKKAKFRVVRNPSLGPAGYYEVP